MDNKELKHLNRKIRVLRLWAVSQAYHHYTMMQLNRKVLQHDNSWQDAMQLSQWMNVIMPHKESSPTDFLHDKNEVSDTVLDNYDEFKKWEEIAEKVGISKKALTAFCKGVDNLQFAFYLKVFGHIFYPEWFAALFLYLHDAISKTDLQNIVVEYSLFTGKAKPANLSELRKTILEIEKNILEITSKQIHRKYSARY